ncbi:MAG: serine/threonine-protein kinase [Candidatus Obscuribacter sp.]|nr:serine/threonine protein kinase [Candidatus Melainabacteria bacterium]MDX1986210.1 serine/threonine-protein kinase [Candidatus Obscuribacter sp.]
MKSELVNSDKYPVITAGGASDPVSLCAGYLRTLIALSIGWLLLCAVVHFAEVVQLVLVLVCAWVHLATDPKLRLNTFRSKVDLKAKGLDIEDPYLSAVMPWDWLTRVEIRQRRFNLIPNYVYFAFKNGQDVLLLWDDVKDTMDSTTLISCVRTWAPHAEVVGDANLSKSESIATYTELWLREMSSEKCGARRRQDQKISVGTVLNECYQVEKVLSGGGQGTAYLSRVLPVPDLPSMPEQVVIKELVLPANAHGLKKATDSLVKEVAILRRVDHPSIIRLYDFFIEDMCGYLVIEYVDGVTLRQLVSQSGPLPESRVAAFGRTLCRVLSYLHELSPPIVHGDVTPDNIMVDRDGRIKLLDFDASQELTRNKTNTIVGKHAYMSPEQFKGMLGESCDVYALGCTLYFLLTAEDPEPLQESCPASASSSVSESMNQVVLRATRLNSALRYASLLEMGADLEQL